MMKIEAHAKINLTLDVYGRRPDGYHALRSVVMPISLSDTLELAATEDGSITSDTGYDDDLCVKAARALKSSVSGLPSTLGATIRVTKRIPAGGGLGGGSADAAATLVALNELWALGKSRMELAKIGAQAGSDVPALVLGGPVLMEGRGEKVTPLAVAPSVSSLAIVLVNPGVFSSTKEVYAACAVRAAEAPSPTDGMIRALASGDWDGISAALANDLQAPACRLHPEIAAAMDALRAAGAQGVAMSGSGSSVFGLMSNLAAAQRLAAALADRGLRTWALDFLV